MAAILRKTYSFIKIMQLKSKLLLRKWSPADKNYCKKFVTKLYLVPIAKGKYPSIRVKIYKTFFFFKFLPLFVSYLLSVCDLYNMPCLS